MDLLNKVFFSLKKLFSFGRANSELDDEIQFHIEMSIEQKVANGMSREKAELEAKREFGNDLSIRESCRMSWGARFVDELQQDFAYAIRRLFSNKLYSFSIILILASCIAVSIFNYNNLDRNILNPTSIPQANEIITLQKTWGSAKGYRYGFSHHFYEQLKEQDTSAVFDDIALLGYENYFAYINNKTERISVGTFTPSAWEVISIPPAAGRYFTEEDIVGGNKNLVVLKYKQALTWFGSAQNALKKQVRLNGEQYEVIGVLPQSFRLMHNKFEAVIPLLIEEIDYMANPAMLFQKSSDCILRLNRGATLDQVRSIVEGIVDRECESNKGYAQFEEHLKIRHLVYKYTETHSYRKLDTKTLQYSFAFLSVLLFLIGVLNSNTLLSVQLGNRSKELVARYSLGAKRMRMLQQIGIESTLLYLISLLLGGFSISTYVLVTKTDYPSVRSLLFPLALILFGFLTSVVVILRKTRKSKLELNLKEAQSTSSRRSKGLASLVGVQVMLTVFILLIALFLTINVNRVINEDYGFNYENKLITKVRCPGWKYNSDATLTGNTIEKIKTVFESTPWVSSYSISEDLPQAWSIGYPRRTGISNASTNVSSETAEKYPNIMLVIYRADENFKSQLGMKLLKGRWLNEFDAATPEREMVFEKKFIEELFPDKDPIGSVFHDGEQGPIKVVGIVDTIEYDSNQFKTSFDETSYNAYEHIFEDHSTTKWVNHAINFAFLTPNPTEIKKAQHLQKQIQSVDHDLHVETVTYRDEIMSKNERLVSARNTSLILAIFTFILASYGLFSYLVYRFHLMKKELAIRIALGAKFKEILLRFISRQSIPVFLGTAVGAIIAFVAVNKYQDRFTEVTPSDPLPYLCITLLMLLLLTLAALLPFYQLKKLPLRDTLTIE